MSLVTPIQHGIAFAGASASVFTAVAACIWTNKYYCLFPSSPRPRLAARLCDFALETPVPFVPYDWKRLRRTRDLCESLETLCEWYGHIQVVFTHRKNGAMAEGEQKLG